MQTTDFDAIVIGSGITGGWAAKELTEQGLKVLMVDRGQMIEHGKDYITEHQPPWADPLRGKPLRDVYQQDYPVQSRNYLFDETTRHYFNNDKDNPYANQDEFTWFRTDVVGGRSLLWGRQVYRWSDLDFGANLADGHGIDWPIRYQDIEPWYRKVEEFIGVSGQAEGLAHLPDSVFLPAMSMNVVEEHAKAKIEQHFDDRIMTIGRAAVLTRPHLGRGACHYCGPCHRGCSVGAYFSTQSSTLPAARATGNLTLLANTAAERIDYDSSLQRATGVTTVNTQTLERKRFSAKLIFVCSSSIASAALLLNSRSEAFPTGLANRSGTLGHYLMDHTYRTGATGVFTQFNDFIDRGNRPNGIYIPRFQNIGKQDRDFVRGYNFQGAAMRIPLQAQALSTPGFGADYKHSLRTPGPWIMYLMGFGECLPRYENRMELLHDKTDRLGLPQIRFHFEWSDNEHKIRADIMREAQAMLEAAGAVAINPFNWVGLGGEAIHEMGTARMGKDPASSVLNKWNQTHDVPNVFVTDGACMTSSSSVNPSLTYMALTARAANYAAQQLAEGLL